MKLHNEIIPKDQIKINNRIAIGIIVFVLGALAGYVAWVALKPPPTEPLPDCEYLYKQDYKNDR